MAWTMCSGSPVSAASAVSDLHVDVRHARGGALRRERADVRRMQAGVIGERGDFDAAAVREVGDVAVVANVAHEAERLAGGDGFHDPRAIFDAAMLDRGGLELQRIDLGIFLGHRLAPLVIRAALAAEGGLVAVEVHRLFVLAEPGDVFAEMAGGFGHEVAEVAEDLAADFFVLVILGLLEHLAQFGIEIAALCVPGAGTNPCD